MGEITCGYGAKYHGLMRFLPNSIISIFFMRVTTSSLCVTILPDCRGVVVIGVELQSSGSSTLMVGVVGVDGSDVIDVVFYVYEDGNYFKIFANKCNQMVM